MKQDPVRRTVTLGVLAAISVVLCYVVRFPIFPAAAWLEYEPADVPLLLATFLYGPFWGLGLTALVCALQALTVSAASGVIGFIMHLCATGSFVLVTGMLLGRPASKDSRIHTGIAVAAGTLTAIAMMIPLNLWLTPLYGTPVEAVRSMLLPIILPFNAIKFGVNGILTAVLYRALRGYLKDR